MTRLKSQTVIANPPGRGGARRANPYAFTEEGVAMLSSVLRSPTAVAVNIEIMRAFVRLRRLIASHADLARRLDALEKKLRKVRETHQPPAFRSGGAGVARFTHPPGLPPSPSDFTRHGVFRAGTA